MDSIDSLTDRLQTAFAKAMRKIAQQFGECKEFNLTSPQFFILKLLTKKKRWMVSELAERMSVKPSAITVMIDRLVQNQLAERERDDRDRRVVYIQLTAAGEDLLEKVDEKRREILSEHLRCLEPEELETFVLLTEKLADHISNIEK